MALVISIPHIVAAPRSRAEVVRTLAVQLRATRAKPAYLQCDLFHHLETWDAIAMIKGGSRRPIWIFGYAVRRTAPSWRRSSCRASHAGFSSTR